jgi:hypothetical protein
MVGWYKIVCAAIVMAYLITTARGYPVLNMVNRSVGAQKGASQFHK